MENKSLGCLFDSVGNEKQNCVHIENLCYIWKGKAVHRSSTQRGSNEGNWTTGQPVQGPNKRHSSPPPPDRRGGLWRTRRLSPLSINTRTHVTAPSAGLMNHVTSVTPAVETTRQRLNSCDCDRSVSWRSLSGRRAKHLQESNARCQVALHEKTLKTKPPRLKTILCSFPFFLIY